jgi:hypothetical protein
MPSRRALLIAVVAGCASGATGLAAFADAPKAGFSPDPPAHASRINWIFDITTRDGKVNVEKVRSVTYAHPAETPRVVGRYALELYIGRELLDRVRFNAPLMGGEAPIRNRNNFPKPRFDQNVVARLEARMADNDRAAYLLLVDRETGAVQKLRWPPEPDGRLATWYSGLSDASPGDFPEGGVRAVGPRAPDGGSDAGETDAGGPAARDAGRP